MSEVLVDYNKTAINCNFTYFFLTYETNYYVKLFLYRQQFFNGCNQWRNSNNLTTGLLTQSPKSMTFLHINDTGI